MKFKETKISKLQLRSSYFTSIISNSLVLYMIGLLALLLFNAKKLSDYVKENIGFSVILNDQVSEADIIQLRKNLEATPFVKATKYVTKEEAAKDLQKELGEDFVDFLGYNPLLSSIDVNLHAQYANPDSLKKIEQEIKTYPQVKEIYYQKSLVGLVNENIRKISLILLSFSGLLALIAVALINNTIRLSVYARRFLINTMQLVGATNSFIRKPFLYKSILHGIYGSVIAIVLLVSTFYFAQKEIRDFISFQDPGMLILVFASVLVVGIVINTIATYFAINKYLRLKEDDLYY